MLIIPYVCAEFHDRSGNILYRIAPEMLHTIQDAPESIKQDILFDMLVKDGSIKTPETTAQKQLLEQDPMIGMNADGRSAVIAGGDQQGGAEVSRNERSVRGTVATIEAADKEEKPEKADKPVKTQKSEKTELAEPVKADTGNKTAGK